MLCIVVRILLKIYIVIRRHVLINVLRVITIFPNFFDEFSKFGVVGKAIQSNKIFFRVHDLRDYGVGKHKSVDDTPYGGGPGM